MSKVCFLACLTAACCCAQGNQSPKDSAEINAISFVDCATPASRPILYTNWNTSIVSSDHVHCDELVVVRRWSKLKSAVEIETSDGTRAYLHFKDTRLEPPATFPTFDQAPTNKAGKLLSELVTAGGTPKWATFACLNVDDQTSSTFELISGFGQYQAYIDGIGYHVLKLDVTSIIGSEAVLSETIFDADTPTMKGTLALRINFATGRASYITKWRDPRRNVDESWRCFSLPEKAPDSV